MEQLTDDQIIKIVKSEMGMALGCTEPIAVALAVAKAREILGKTPERIELFLSGNIYKNGLGVGIPGTPMRGVIVAAALGALTGSSEDKLELLKNVSPEITEKAVEMVKSGKIHIHLKENVDKLYIEACLFAGHDHACAIVQKKHTNLVFASLNGNPVFRACEEEKCYTETESGKIEGLSIDRLYKFAENVPLEKIQFLAEGIEPNWNIAMEGLKNNYGFTLGKTIHQTICSDDDWMRSGMSKVAAGVDARMAGSILPVMTNSGSGNQGITIYAPIIDAWHKLGSGDEELLLRALALGNSVPVHIKRQIGPLSALCGIVPASIGAACGIALLRGATLAQVQKIVQLVIANTSGMLCDGAKSSCAIKASTGIAAAYQAIFVSLMTDREVYADGILDRDVEKSIDNLALIASTGMSLIDGEILEIMNCKKKS